jgi:hypothetical protein
MSKVINGFAESTRNIHQINKENMAAVRADSKANFDAATAPDPGLVKVKNTKGLLPIIIISKHSLFNTYQMQYLPR